MPLLVRSPLCALWLLAACPAPADGAPTEGTGSTGSTLEEASSSPQTTDAQTSTSSGVDSSSSGGSSTSAGTTSTSGSSSSSGDSSDGGSAACYPDGIYGRCSDNPGCQCLQGATVYQVCTSNCESAEECGDPADFPGAMPICAPINPGAAQMICALVCTDTRDCPCGLVCMPSGVANISICAEAQ